MQWKVALPLATILASTACASLVHEGDGPHHWPRTNIAQRDISVAAVYADTDARPAKLWLISTPDQAGARYALEFFTGERVSDVQVDKIRVGASSKSAPEVETYSFTDTKGHHYVSVRDYPSTVNSDQQEIYAGWHQGNLDHDVYLGGYLFEEKRRTTQDEVYRSTPIPVDPGRFFSADRSCDARVYVTRTQGSQAQSSATGFIERARIIADYDAAQRCWNTRPIHAVNLDDNTFLVTTATRAFRINSWDLTPAGSAPDLRIIDTTEK